MKLLKLSIQLSFGVFLVSTNLFAGAHAVAVHGPNGSAGAVFGKTPGGRYFAVGGVRSRGRGSHYNASLYNPYSSYWSYYPTANYYNGSFGYWNSSYGAYGSYYTQPGLFTSYQYGPYGYSSSNYFTPTYGSHTGLFNFSYTRTPGSGFSLSGTGPYGYNFSLTGLKF